MNIFSILIIFLLVIFCSLFLKMKKEISIYFLATRICAISTFLVLVFIILFVAINGIFSLKPSMFSLNYTSQNMSMLPAIFTTLITVLISILLASPLGIFTAIFLIEYTNYENKFLSIIRLANETLAGIPSIIYGLFGMMFFVTELHLGFSIIAGVFTVSIMILPIIIRATEEALKDVSPKLREASFALGAGKLRTIFLIVLPVAMPSILAGIILAIGRVVGETAALMYTLGTATSLPTSLDVSSRTLALHMYVLSTEGKYVGEAYAAGFVLLVLILIINYFSTKIATKFRGVQHER